ncbi:MAG: DUF6502 family protein [Pseudomonadota bacterium]
MTVRSGPGEVVPWEPTELVSTLLSAGARQVVTQWISSAGYLDDHNDPVLLSMAGEDDGCFARLVHQANRELAPAVILTELLRKGIVEQHVNGQLLLRRSAYAPGQPSIPNKAKVECPVKVARPLRRRRYTDLG